MITDHPFKPCYHNPEVAEAIPGLCVCPYGPWRCHKKGCGELPEAHEVQTPYKKRRDD